MKKIIIGKALQLIPLKISLKMKLTYFLLFVSLLQSYANTYSQNKKVTLEMEEVTLRSVFDEIEQKTDFKFLYEKGVFQTDKIVSIFAKKEKLSSVLDKLLKNLNVSVEYIQKQIIIKREYDDGLNAKQLNQSKITGVITDENGLPLAGAVVLIKGTTTGVSTDFDGRFSIDATEGAILEISFLGYLTQEIIATNKPLEIILKENNLELEEIIVVAQGIEKSRKALGYAISKVDTEETETRPESDIARTLQGKISGVLISPSNGSSGASASIRVRGNLSLNQDNAALIVVDNVPFSGNLLDIDPNSIENITVLKGLNAAVLYGSDGRNGVILVETKAAAAKVGVKSFTAKITQTSYTNTVANLPDFQNTYGVGNNLVTDASTIGNYGSNGARFTDIDFIPHPLAGNSSFPEFANAEAPYEAARNNVKDFFNTGIGQITSVNLSATGEKTSLNFSLGYTDEGGILGNNDFKRYTMSLGGTSQLTDKLKLSASISYSSRNRNSQNGGDIVENAYIIPRSLDIHNLPFQDPVTGANVYYRTDEENPKWIIENTGTNTIVRRMNATVNLAYEFNEHHTLKYRGGLQVENGNSLSFRNKGGIGATEALGSLDIDSDNEFDIDNTFILASSYKISDKIGFDSQLGVNSRYETFRSQESEYSDQLVFGVLRPNNFRTPGEGDFDTNKRNLFGAFGQFDFDYDRFLYLNLSGRFDKGASVEKANQNLFYPGISVSFIPTSAFDFGDSFVNYLKIRAAYATSSGFPNLFNTRASLSSDPREFSDINGNLIVTNSLFGTLPNANLKPELHKEFELGLEGNFFNNTITLQASVFSRISDNQIFETGIAPATGFTDTVINAGRVDTEGIEIDLGIKLFKESAFNWNIRNTFTSFKSVVVDLPGDLTRRDNIIEGEEIGILLGSYVVRDSEGNALINPATGVLITSEDVGLQDEIIGNFQPDFRATSIHTLSYKNFKLSTQLEYTHGGDRRSDLFEILLERGVTTDTENREGSFVIPGVLGDVGTGLPILDANGNTVPNNIQVTGNNAVFSNFYDAEENRTFDDSVFRIREIALSYRLNKSTFKKLPFESVDFTLSGRNLFFYAPGFPAGFNFDPETTGITTPTTKRYALSVSINF